MRVRYPPLHLFYDLHFFFVTKVLTMSHAGTDVDAVLTSPLQEGLEALPDAIAIPLSPVPEPLGSGSVGMLFLFVCMRVMLVGCSPLTISLCTL